MFTSKVYCFSTASSYASLTLGVMKSTAGVTVSLAAMLAFKLCPTLSPCAPEFHRTPTPICSQRRSRRSSVDTVASDTSGFACDSASTLVEPNVKREPRLSAAFIRKLFIKLANLKAAKKEIRPMARRLFTTSTTSLFSPASESYLPRVTSTSVKAAVKKVKRNSADMIIPGRKTAFPNSSGDVVVPSPLVRKLYSLVTEECDSEEFTPFAEESPFKKRKAFRPAKMSRKIARACVQLLL